MAGSLEQGYTVSIGNHNYLPIRDKTGWTLDAWFARFNYMQLCNTTINQGTTKCGSTGAMLQGSEQFCRQQRKEKRGKQREKKKKREKEKERGEKRGKKEK